MLSIGAALAGMLLTYLGTPFARSPASLPVVGHLYQGGATLKLRTADPLPRDIELEVKTKSVQISGDSYALWVLLEADDYTKVYPYALLSPGADLRRHVALGGENAGSVGHQYTVQVCKVGGDVLAKVSSYLNSLTTQSGNVDELRTNGIDLSDYTAEFDCYSKATLHPTRGV